MIALDEYVDGRGRNQFRAWFNGLDVSVATKVTVGLERISQGNKSSVKGVGEGLSEYKIDFGPGYRVYFGKDGEQLVILLGGGTKQRQNQDIADPKAAWHEYKQRKRAILKQAAKKADTKSKTKKKRK